METKVGSGTRRKEIFNFDSTNRFKKIFFFYILPLSQELLNSVRMLPDERIRTGSEPRKFIDVAE